MLIDFDETGGLLQAYTKPVAGRSSSRFWSAATTPASATATRSTRLSALQALRTKP